MKKILFFIDSLNGGGAERALVNLVNNLDPQKYDITVMTLYDVGLYRDKLATYVKYKTANVHSFRGINYIYKLIPAVILHNRYIKENYDLEVAFLEGISTKIISGGPKNTRRLAWVRIDVSKYKSGERCYLNRKQLLNCYSKFHNIAFVGEDALKSFELSYGINRNLYVVRNIFEYTDMLSKSKSKCDLSNYNKPIFVSVGRLEKQKGYSRLIDVCTKLYNENYNFTLLILGKGSLEDELQRKIDDLKVADNIKLLGFDENPFKFIKNADWFISSSYFEGFSSVIREAVILGTPIIATDCSGVKEVLGNSEFGILSENTTLGLYNAMKNVLDNPELLNYYKKKTIERQSLFDYKKTIDCNKMFIESCLGN